MPSPKIVARRSEQLQLEIWDFLNSWADGANHQLPVPNHIQARAAELTGLARKFLSRQPGGVPPLPSPAKKPLRPADVVIALLQASEALHRAGPG